MFLDTHQKHGDSFASLKMSEIVLGIFFVSAALLTGLLSVSLYVCTSVCVYITYASV